MNRFVVGSRGIRVDGLRQHGGVLALALSLFLGLSFAGAAATATTTGLVSSVNPSVYGQSVTFTATISPTPDGGTVAFKDGTTDISGAVTVASGQAQFSTSSLSTGAHSITAEYSGTTNYDASASGPLTQTVVKADTSVSVSSSVNPSVTGESVTFTATVSAVSPGAGSATGTVDFYADGNLVSAACALSAGTATCSHTFPHVESPVAITAFYSGNSNFNPSDNELNPLTQTVNKASTTTSITSSASSWLGEPYTVSGTVSVTSPGTGTPTGTVTVSDGAGASCAANLVAGTWSCSLTSSGAAGTRTLTAVYEGDESFAGSTGTTTHTVSKVTTTLAVTTARNPSFVGEAVTITATVTAQAGGGSPTGTVSFSIGTTPLGSAALGASGTDQSKAVLVTTEIPLGTHTITATYPGDGRFEGSSATTGHTVEKRPTTTTVFGSDTPLVVNDTVTATVTVSSPGSVPTGTVTVSVSPTNEGSPTSWSHTLVPADGGQFAFSYTPTSAEGTPHTFTATYAGDSAHEGSSGTFDQEIQQRALDMEMTLAPTTAYVLQPVSITIHMEDDTTEGTPDSLNGLEIVLDNDGKNGTFSDDTPTLNSSGDCTVTYTPGAGDAGSSSAITTITATYEGSDVYAAKQLSQQLTVALRPTSTTVEFNKTEGIYVYEPATFSVTVEDTAGPAAEPVSPAGSIAISAEKTYYGGTRGVSYSSTNAPDDYTRVWNYDYLWTALIAEGADYDVVTSTYTPNDGIHLSSEGSAGKGVNRRPTEVTVTCAGGTPTGFEVIAQVTEKGGVPGIPTIPLGNFVMLEGEDLSETVVGAAPLAVIAIATDLPMVSPTILYSPSDYIHVKSPGTPSEPCTKMIDTSGGGDGTTGGACADGCGSGGVDIYSMIWTLNAESTLLHAVQMGLSAAVIVTSFIPNPVWAAGLGFSSGTDIPIKEIVEAILNGTSLALEVAIVAMQTDMDGDGLPDVIERNVTGTDPDVVDTDADAMSDSDEIGYCAGYYGGTLRPNPNISDSDGDGLRDGYELAPFSTDLCVADTDCDTLPDGVEVACRTLPDEGNGFDMTTFAALGYSAYTFPFGDLRDHPNPREGDTDGDGLNDSIEFGPGDLATSTLDSTYSPYVNDSDSDGDGILDGNESTDGNATWDYVQIGGTGTTGSGETHLCFADSDNDGLTDGEEEGLFGQGPIEVHSTLGTITTPALDDDSDDDGLSDYEEQVVTHTDPLNWDSDGDSLSDSNEMLALSGAWPIRTFAQVSDPLDPDTDDDGLRDDIEYTGTGLGTTRGLGGNGDDACPYVNDDDSDDDGLQDGAESWDGNGTITIGIMGDSSTQAQINPSGETAFCNPDTDGDGLTDGEEVALLGGLPIDGVNGFTPVIAEGVSTTFGQAGAALTGTVPPLDDDSDNDGLSDYEEIVVTGTDPLDADTDNDTLSDADELIAVSGTWPHRSFIQESNPLDPDTDDDGLPDAIEYPGTGLGSTYLRGLGGNPDIICPFVNDDDSDDDGLQDGYEDDDKDSVPDSTDRDGIWNNYQIGDSTTQGWGETCACNPDSDGDGLQDGEEEGLLGRTATPQGVSTVLPMGNTTPPSGYIVLAGSMRGTGNDLLAPYVFTPEPGLSLQQTVPALDTDSDNDGLSDWEEVNVTGTDPLDADTDDDTLADADELVAVSGTWPNRQFDQVSDPLSINTDGDHLFDPQEFAGSGLRALAGGLGGTRDLTCPYVNDADSDDDGIQDGAIVSRTFTAVGVTYSWTHYEDFGDIAGADVAWPGTVRTVVTVAGGEQNDDTVCNVCDADSDGDGLLDGEETGIGTDPGDWDTDDDGRNDWHEVTGGGPIPTDPFDPDTDDDGLLDSAEVFGSNPTNPVHADTDSDGLTDGGARTPYMGSGHPSVVINPLCLTGIGGHPNPLGIGENERGDGARHPDETDPNNPDTDGDAVGDGIERLSFSVSRQHLIPATDLFGRPITVVYPEANNVKPVCGCMDPLNPDSDGDGLLDGEEDLNHDGHFDFLLSDFDHGHHGPIPGPAIPHRMETNPCDPDTDHDGLTDGEELRGQTHPPAFFPFNPTNPLDHDTDNDWLFDGEEVRWVCTELTVMSLDNDGDGLIDEDPVDGLDNDGDGLIDEDDVDFYVRYVPVLDPTNRDSDSDGFIDGLDPDPCNSQPIPIVAPVVRTPVDTDGDRFADEDEIAAGTDPRDPESFPQAFTADLDLDGVEDDRLWLTAAPGDGMANTVTIDIDANILIDIRVQILAPRDMQQGDFDGDGEADDCRYTVSYAFANRRVLQPRITLLITDRGCDRIVDEVAVKQ